MHKKGGRVFVFYDVFEQLCKQHGISCKKAATDMGFSNSTTTKWKRGSNPNGATAQRIAEYFGVSVDYLFGRTTDPTDYSSPDLIAGISTGILDYFGGNVKKAIAFDDAVRADIANEQRATALLKNFSQLDDTDKSKVESFIGYLLTDSKYSVAEQKNG